MTCQPSPGHVHPRKQERAAGMAARLYSFIHRVCAARNSCHPHYRDTAMVPAAARHRYPVSSSVKSVSRETPRLLQDPAVGIALPCRRCAVAEEERHLALGALRAV